MSGSSTLACAVVRASRLNDWNTKPMRLLRTAASSLGAMRRDVFALDGHCAGRSGWSSRPTMCMSVDLPEPEGPMMASISPSHTCMLTPQSASTSTSSR